jgi:glycosyltransferase involved in cell wall biosynthesis
MEVTVLLITYNHEKYIAQALDSVLMQETDFDYEIVVLEDCSTDATREILRGYQKRYPDKIRLRLAERNEPTSSKPFAEEFQAAPSRYIATLDGDDYWTSPRKLQIQVEFLRAHPECVLCFHNAMRVYEDQRLPIPYNSVDQKAFSEIEDVWKYCFIAGATPMFRKNVLRKLPEWYYNMPFGDWPLYILYAEHGKIGYIDEILSVYRIHSGGLWTKQNNIQKLESLIEAYERMNANLEFRYNHIAQSRISKWKKDLEIARRVDKLAASVLPREATVIVMSAAHEDLPQLGARKVWPFPERTSTERRSRFASGTTGSAEAKWIQTGHLYKFSLHSAASEDIAFSSVSVTQGEVTTTPNRRANAPSQNNAFITATPNPVPMESDPGKTVISWSTGDGSPGVIYVSIEDQRMRYPVDGREAIEQVEKLRARGGEFLIAPRNAFIFFERYPELEEHLGLHYRIIEDDEMCRIYDLRENASENGDTAGIQD